MASTTGTELHTLPFDAKAIPSLIYGDVMAMVDPIQNLEQDMDNIMFEYNIFLKTKTIYVLADRCLGHMFCWAATKNEGERVAVQPEKLKNIQDMMRLLGFKDDKTGVRGGSLIIRGVEFYPETDKCNPPS